MRLKLLSTLLVTSYLLSNSLFSTSEASPIGTEEEKIEITRLQKPIVFDGIIDDKAWKWISPLPMTMYTPDFEGKITESTEILVAYDDDYLYVAGKFFDSDPLQIRSNSLERDRLTGDDTFEIILDTFNDNQNALAFVINPSGTRRDIAIFNDAEYLGNEPFNQSWNTYWEVRTHRDDNGWYAELRIPFSSLRFRNVEGKVEMGLIVSRYIARKNERQLYPSIDPKYSFNKPSAAQDIIISDIKSTNPIYHNSLRSRGK